MPKGKGTYGKKVGRPSKKAVPGTAKWLKSKKKGKKEFGNLQWAAHTLEAAEAGGPKQAKNRRKLTYEDTPQECLKDSRGVYCEYWFEILGEFEDDDDEAERPCMDRDKGRAKKAKR